MENTIGSSLEAIVRSIDEIEEFLPDRRDFRTFQNDLKTKKAVERNIEIIGEAVNKIMRNSSVEITVNNAHRNLGRGIE